MRDIEKAYREATIAEYESLKGAGRDQEAAHVAGVLRDQYGYEAEPENTPAAPERTEQPPAPERADEPRPPENTAVPHPAPRTLTPKKATAAKPPRPAPKK